MNGGESSGRAITKRGWLFLRTIERLAGWIGSLREALHGLGVQSLPAAECLEALMREERRARLLGRAPRVKCVAVDGDVSLPSQRSSRFKRELTVLDAARESGIYQWRLGAYPSIFDAMLDFASRVVLAMPGDEGMDAIYEDAILIDPTRPQKEMEDARAWAIRMSMLANEEVGSLIALAQSRASLLLCSGECDLWRSRVPNSVSPYAITYLPTEEQEKVYDFGPTESDVQIVPEFVVASICTQGEASGAKALWRQLSDAWWLKPGRSFSAVEAAGEFDGKELSGNRRRDRDRLFEVAVGGKPILIRAKSKGSRHAYYMITVLGSAPELGTG